jgi:hypothetical protein
MSIDKECMVCYNIINKEREVTKMKGLVKGLMITIGVLAVLTLAFLAGRDLGANETKDYVIHQQEIHEDDTYYYVDIDGERYSYFKD